MAKDLDRTTQPLIGYQIPGIASTEAYHQAAAGQGATRKRLAGAIKSINEDIINTRDTNYKTKLSIDTRNKYLDLQNEHKLDLEGFKREAELWYAETKKVIPSKYYKDLDNMNNDFGGRAYYNIQGNIINAEREGLKISLGQESLNISTDRDNDYEQNGFSAFIGGDYEKRNHDVISELLSNNLIIPAEVPVLKYSFKNNTTKQLSMYTLRSILDTGIKEVIDNVNKKNLSPNDQRELIEEVFNKAGQYVDDVKEGKATSIIKTTLKRDFAKHPDLEDKLKEIDNINAKDSDALATNLDTILSNYQSKYTEGNKAHTTELNERQKDFFENGLEKNIMGYHSLYQQYLKIKKSLNSKTQRYIENDLFKKEKYVDRYQLGERIQNGDLPGFELSSSIPEHQQGIDDVFQNPIFQIDLDGLQLARAQDFSTSEAFGAWYEQGDSASNAVRIADFVKSKNGMIPTSVQNYLLTLSAPLNEESYTKAIQLYVSLKNIGGANADAIMKNKMGAHLGLKEGIDADANKLYPRGLHSTPSEDMIKTVVKDRREIIKNLQGSKYKSLYVAAAGYRKDINFKNEENVFKELGNQNIPQFIEDISKPNGLIPDTRLGFVGKWWRNVFAGDESKKQMIEAAIETQSDTLFDKVFNDLDFELDNSVIQMLPNMIDDILVKAKVESYPIPSDDPKQFNNWLKSEIMDELLNVRGLRHSPIHTSFDKRNPQLRDRPLQIGSDEELFYGTMNYWGLFNNKEFYEAGEMSSTNPSKIIGTAFLGNRLQRQAKNSTMGIDYPDFTGIKNYNIEVMAMSAQIDAIAKNLSSNDRKLINAYNTLQTEFLNPNLQRDEEGNIIPNAQINFLIEQINSRVPKEWGNLPTAINPASWGKYFKTNTKENDILRKMSEGRYEWRQNLDGSTSVITWNFNEDGKLIEENLTNIIEEETGNQFKPDKNQTIQKRAERYGNMAITEDVEDIEKEVDKHSAWMEKGEKLYDELKMNEGEPIKNATKQAIKNLIKTVIIHQYTESKIKGVEFWTTWRGRRTSQLIGLFNREGILTDDINILGTKQAKESLEHLIGKDIYNDLGGDQIQHITYGHLSIRDRLKTAKIKSDYTVPSIKGIEYETRKGKQTKENRRLRLEKIKQEYANAMNFKFRE